MAAAVWMVLAVGTMVVAFAGCVVAVAAGVRLLEGALAKRRQGKAG